MFKLVVENILRKAGRITNINSEHKIRTRYCYSPWRPQSLINPDLEASENSSPITSLPSTEILLGGLLTWRALHNKLWLSTKAFHKENSEKFSPVCHKAESTAVGSKANQIK